VGLPIQRGPQAGVDLQGGALASGTDQGGAPRGHQRNGGQGENSNPLRVAGTMPHGGDQGIHNVLGSNSQQGVEGVLAETLPIDLTALDRAIDHCLGQIDDMGETLGDLLGADGAMPWLAGAVIASAAGAAAHWWGRRARYRPLTVVNGEGTISSWFLESISRA
jgi:hypothetical protein